MNFDFPDSFLYLASEKLGCFFFPCYSSYINDEISEAFCPWHGCHPYVSVLRVVSLVYLSADFVLDFIILLVLFDLYRENLNWCSNCSFNYAE